MENTNLLRILFVEDVASDAILAEREIRKSGLEFSSQRVDTKDAFMKALEEFRPDIVVSDYSMPEFDGMRALKLSLAYDSRIPFILLTGSMNEETAVLCMKAGASDYVIKEHMKRLPFAVKDALEEKKTLVKQHEAERALREGEAKYRILVDNANEAIVVVQDGLIKFVNRNALELAGYSEREFSTKPFTEFIHPDDRKMVVENYTKRVKGKTVPLRYSFRIVTLDGSVRWVETGAAMLEWQGKPATLNFLTDITERKNTEATLLDETTRRRVLFEQSPDGIVLIDPQTAHIIEFNTAAHRQLGYSREEFAKLSIMDVEADETREDTQATITRVMRERRADFETLQRTKDGEIRNVSVTAQYIDVLGHPVYQCFWRDITGRKRGEEKIALLAHTLKSISECVSITDLNDRILFVNQAFLDTYGYNEQELLGKNINVVRSPNNPPEIAGGINAATLKGSWQGELLNRKKDGSEFPVLFSTSFVQDDSGRSIALVGVATDITEREKDEESRQLLTTAIETSANGVAVTDLKGIIVWANKAFTVMTGYSLTEVLGQNPNILKSGKQNDSFYKNLWETISAGNVWMGELINKRKDGSLYTEEMTITPVRTQKNKITHFVALKQDITDRKKAELNLRLSEERFRSVWDNSADGMRLTNREGRVIDVNPAYCSLVKVSREDSLGKVFSIAYQRHGPNDDLTEYHGRFDVRETTSNLFGSATLWNGESIDLDVSSAYIEVAGQERLLLSILRDVTEQRKSQKHLEEERALLRTMINAIPDEICVKDLERRFVLVNPATVGALKRFSEKEIIGKRDEDLIPEKFALLAKEEEELALTSGRPYLNRVGDSRINPVSGEIERSILISKIPLKDSTGKVVGLVGINRDITDVSRVSAALEKERTLLLTLIESIPDEVCLKDLAHRFLVVNTGIVRAIGARSIQDLLGKTDFDYMSPEIAQAHFDEEDALLETGQPIINLEKILLNPITGEIDKSMLTTKVPVKDSTGKNIGILVINRRNTERKRAEEELRTSEERLRILFEYAPDAYYLVDLHGNFIDGNKAAEELVGSATADIIGKNFFTLGLLKQEDMPKASASLGKNSRGLPSGPDEFTLNLKDGSRVEVEIRTYPVTIRNEVLVLGIARDVSQRKRSEEALRASEEKFRALFEESKDTVYFSTVDGRLLDINPAGIEMLGYSSKEDLLRVFLTRDGYADANEKKRFDAQMEADGFVRDFEVTLKRKDGGKLTVLETAVAVRDKAGKIAQYRGIMRDVTRQRQLEAQFLQSQKMESIGTLAGGIAHDFNNILGIVLGHLALLERTRHDDNQFEESIYSITKAVDRGASLVRQILTFARKTDPEFEPVNINSAIKELAKMLDETFPKTMPVTVHLDKTIPAISLDPSQLHQAFLNLCVNARDAMNGTGTLHITTKLVPGSEVSLRFPEASAGYYVRVTVADNGPGMDDEIKRRIFEPFFTTKEKGKGTGLGLAVVYGVLKAHHGFIDVESTVGAGSAFHLFFPVPEGLIGPVVERVKLKDDLARGTETILIVEDEDILRDLLVKLLEMQGFKVIAASDGDDAVRRFNEHAAEIDLVVSDMGLPKRSGWDAFKAMQKTKSNVRALLASGYIDPGQKSEVIASGVKGFVQKPYRMEEVLKAIRDALDAK